MACRYTLFFALLQSVFHVRYWGNNIPKGKIVPFMHCALQTGGKTKVRDNKSFFYSFIHLAVNNDNSPHCEATMEFLSFTIDQEGGNRQEVELPCKHAKTVQNENILYLILTKRATLNIEWHPHFLSIFSLSQC